VEISSPFEGTVTSISFKPGDTVKTGSTLLIVDVAEGEGAGQAPSTVSVASSTPAPQPAAKALSPKVRPFLLSDIGEGIAEVEVRKVFVKPGDKVQQYDRIVEVESDKVLRCHAVLTVCVCRRKPLVVVRRPRLRFPHRSTEWSRKFSSRKVTL
jgi:pyruvate/2-oxoglutarate dehydrogenase complex dihydrolipoamide acyltransferase (E2) component